MCKRAVCAWGVHTAHAAHSTCMRATAAQAIADAVDVAGSAAEALSQFGDPSASKEQVHKLCQEFLEHIKVVGACACVHVAPAALRCPGAAAWNVDPLPCTASLSTGRTAPGAGGHGGPHHGPRL